MSNINSSLLLRLLKHSLDRVDPLKEADLAPVGDKVEAGALRVWLARRALVLLQPRLDPNPQPEGLRQFEDGQLRVLMDLYKIIEKDV